MFAVLRRRNFALLWSGQLISLMGDYVLLISIPFFVYQLTGSLLQTGLMFVIETLPRILLGSVTGVFVDRWSRRWTMIVSDLARACILLLLLLVTARNLLWLLYGVTLLQATCSLFFTPALTAITPTLVDEQHLVGANALQSFSDSVTRFIGPPLGGALFALSGFKSVIFIDSASFLFSALMLLFIALPERHKEDLQSSMFVTAKWIAIWQELFGGLQHVSENRVVRTLFVTQALFFISQGIANVVLVVFVRVVMYGDALTLGWMATAQGVGSLLGSFLIARLSKSLRPAYLVAIPLWLAGSLFLLFLKFPHFLTAVFLIALIGVVIVSFFVTTQTLLQINVPDKYRGRVAGALNAITSLALLLGMLITSMLGDRIGSVTLLACGSCLNVLNGVVTFVMLWNVRLRLDHPEIEQDVTQSIMEGVR